VGGTYCIHIPEWEDQKANKCAYLSALKPLDVLSAE